jgi:uncharacterized protein (TIRG00374 family)
MKSFRFLFLAFGLVLFGLVLARSDLKAVADHVGGLGWGVLVGIPAVSLLPFIADTLSWQLVFAPPRPGFGWFTALWKIRMVGSAIGKVTPAVGLAGEPIKAVMLKRIYGVPNREGIASVIVAKTANLVSFVAFVAIGMAVALANGSLPESYRLVAAVGFAVLALGIAAMFAVQRLRILSTLGGWFSRGRLGRRISGILHHLSDMDDRLEHAYTGDRGRFLASTFMAFLYWFFGAVELYLIFWFLGRPVGIGDALAIAGIVELVRAGTFFIPASIGAEEATLAVIVGTITGVAGLGLAVAFVRRYRELLWIGVGFLIAWRITGRSKQTIGTLLRAGEGEGLSA